jgi:hypothetical protein
MDFCADRFGVMLLLESSPGLAEHIQHFSTVRPYFNGKTMWEKCFLNRQFRRLKLMPGKIPSLRCCTLNLDLLNCHAPLSRSAAEIISALLCFAFRKYISPQAE